MVSLWLAQLGGFEPSSFSSSSVHYTALCTEDLAYWFVCKGHVTFAKGTVRGLCHSNLVNMEIFMWILDFPKLYFYEQSHISWASPFYVYTILLKYFSLLDGKFWQGDCIYNHFKGIVSPKDKEEILSFVAERCCDLNNYSKYWLYHLEYPDLYFTLEHESLYFFFVNNWNSD
jgi:hypothetical protein